MFSALVLVLEDQPLYKILDVFQTGQTHMALVYPKGTALGSSSAATPLGIWALVEELKLPSDYLNLCTIGAYYGNVIKTP